MHTTGATIRHPLPPVPYAFTYVQLCIKLRLLMQSEMLKIELRFITIYLTSTCTRNLAY